MVDIYCFDVIVTGKRPITARLLSFIEMDWVLFSKPIEKLPCPKCGKKFSKEVLQHRTHKCEPPVFEDDPEEAPAPSPPPPEPDSGPSLADDYDEEGRPFQPPAQLTRESLSLLIKQERDAKREAKRRMYASQMF